MLYGLTARIRRATRQTLGIAFEPIELDVTYEEILSDLTYPAPSS